MRFHRHILAEVAFALSAACIAACTPAFNLPADTDLSCSGNDKCPIGMTCSASLGRCIVPGDDQIPLDVAGTPQWNTTTAGAGTVLQVTFNASKELGTNPVVSVTTPSGKVRPFALVTASQLNYVYGYRVVGDEGSGAATVAANLIDTFGNVANAQPLGTITLAFTSPSVTAGSVVLSTSLANAGTTVNIQFKTADATTIVKGVNFGGVAATLASPQPASGGVSYNFTVTATTPAGLLAITADLVDGGVAVAAAPVAVLNVDLTPPRMTNMQNATPMSHPGATLTVVLTFSEPLALAPTLSTTNGTFVATQVSAVEYSFTYTVKAADATAGTITLTLTGAEDLAGNVAASSTVGTVPVSSDSQLGLVSGSLAIQSPAAYYIANSVITVDFTTTVPVATPTVNIVMANGGASIVMNPMSMTTSGAGTAYVFAHTVSMNDSQGTATVAVNIVDLFGNAAGPFVAPGQFIIDTHPPTSTLGLQIKPASPVGVGVGVGALLVATVTADKDLSAATLTSGASSTTSSPALTFSTPSISGTAVVWSHTVVTADDGTFSLTGTITDLAGNTTILPAVSVVVDTTPPAIATGGSVSPAYATIGTTLSVSFTTTKQMKSDPIVTMGPYQLSVVGTPSGNSYVYSHQIGSQGDPEFPSTTTAATATAILQDLAGNMANVDVVSGSADIVTLDSSLIVASDVTASPNPAAVGSTITITANAAKALCALSSGCTTTLTVNSPANLTFSVPAVSGSSVVWTHAVTSSDPTGPVAVTLTVSDAAGHAFPMDIDPVVTIQ